MSIDVQKVIQVYDGCLSLLLAKGNLSIDTSEVNALIQRFNHKNMEEKNICVNFIEDAILKVIRNWSKKFTIYDSFLDSHKHSYAQLQFKVDNLKNNNQILSKEDQLISEIQAMMRQWKQNMHPVQYYNIKQRKLLKKNVQEKLEILKGHTIKTKQSNAPLYTRKIQNQFKQNILAAYFQESKIDCQMADLTIKVALEIQNLITKLSNETMNADLSGQISVQKNPFMNSIYDILSRSSKPSDKRIRIYSDNLNETVFRMQQFWQTYRKSIDHTIFIIDQFVKAMLKVKSSFQQNQQKVYKLLVDVPTYIAQIFRVDGIYNHIKYHNTSYGSSTIMFELRDKMFKKMDIVIRMQNSCRQYLNRVINQAYQRKQNIHHYVVIDKKFMQQQAKAEKSITRGLFQSFKQCLDQCYKLARETRKRFQQQGSIVIKQSHQIGPCLTKMIISDNDDLYANNLNNVPKLTREQKNPKISEQTINKIQQFINNIFIFNTGQITDEMIKFSCALGPKLLLHGKLYLHSQGLFFESLFNKKNLLFGKTKLFIPRSEIVEIDMKNTLLVFPDAVIIKTEHGLVSFHALGQRKVISEALKQTYLGSSVAVTSIEGAVISNSPSFKPFDQNNKKSQGQFQKYLQPYEVPISDTFFRGSKLNKIFRTYFSDDKFQINSQTFQNFKSYYLTLIQAKSPSNTPINPPPPPYFTYTSQQSQPVYPQTSTRLHKYIKILPKVPFVSKGGQGQCEQQQIYHWFSPQILVIDGVSVVKGFSLTEGMKINIRTVLRQVNDGVKMTITCEIKFSKDSSTNGLVKSPAISNLKQSMVKMGAVMQKYQKNNIGRAEAAIGNNMGSKQITKMVSSSKSFNHDYETKIQKKVSYSTFQIPKSQIKYVLAGFFVFYILSLLLIKKIL